MVVLPIRGVVRHGWRADTGNGRASSWGDSQRYKKKIEGASSCSAYGTLINIPFAKVSHSLCALKIF